MEVLAIVVEGHIPIERYEVYAPSTHEGEDLRGIQDEP